METSERRNEMPRKKIVKINEDTKWSELDPQLKKIEELL